MKRLWISCVATVAAAALISSASAQSNAPIGSYQSILSKAGYSGGGSNWGSYNAPGNYGSAYRTLPQDEAAAAANQVQAVPDAAPPAAPATANYVDSTGSPCNICDQPIEGRLGCRNPTCGKQGSNSNYVYGISGLIFDRDYEDDVNLSTNGAGDLLRSTDADSGAMGGVEVFLGSRGCKGTGWEARDWGLYPNDATATITGSPVVSLLPGLVDVVDPPSGANYFDIFSNGDSQTITRSTEIHNVEFNVLKNGGRYTTRRNRQAFYELLGGFRWFEFDEDFRYQNETSFGGHPTDTEYYIDAQNTLLGFQVGGRSEICLGQKLRFAGGTKIGVYNNRVRRRQRVQCDPDIAEIGSGAFAGTVFDFNDDKDDVSVLGELDLGLIYQFSSNSRARVGYRAVGVSGIALAPNQIPLNFAYEPGLHDPQSNGDLLLHGVYAGMEFAR